MLSVNVGVEETKDELEVRLFAADERPIDSRFHRSAVEAPTFPTHPSPPPPEIPNCGYAHMMGNDVVVRRDCRFGVGFVVKLLDGVR